MMKTFRGFGRSLLAVLSFVAARGKEPSTYATLTATLGVLHVSADPGVLKQVTLLGIGLCGALGVLLREAGRVNAFQVAADVADELRKGLTIGVQPTTGVTGTNGTVTAATIEIPKPPIPFPKP